MNRPKMDFKELVYENIQQVNSTKIRKFMEKEAKIKEERLYQDDFRRYYENENRSLSELKTQRQKEQLMEYSQYQNQRFGEKAFKQNIDCCLTEKIGIENKFGTPRHETNQYNFPTNQENFYLRQKENQLINQKNICGYNIINGEFSQKNPTSHSSHKIQRIADYHNYLNQLAQLRLRTIGIDNYSNNNDNNNKNNLLISPLSDSNQSNQNQVILSEEDYKNYYDFKTKHDKQKNYKIETPITYNYTHIKSPSSLTDYNPFHQPSSKFLPLPSSILNDRQFLMQKERKNEYCANKQRNSSSTDIMNIYPDMSSKKDFFLNYQLKQESQKKFKASLDNQVNANKQYQIRLDQLRTYGSQCDNLLLDEKEQSKDALINNSIATTNNNTNHSSIRSSESISTKPFIHNVVLSRRLSSGTF